ncbi:RrF2 family transcriptional regulator [Acinetobacter sp. A47]|uniref:RrF2 family transcriptional regulator n=1 Tax=Acinetobacter sp. A47 TaxID=1561217 RepID=UPI00056FA20A|nr:Rrf2 family transcriptional regulator [Acinetobacter sp. A47]
MQLNKFTDYALRILMYVARPSDVPYTIADIAKDLHVSQNHLVKVVHFMGKQQWIVTIRGKGGGLHLNPEAKNLKLGEIVRTLQGSHQIVECNTPPCVLRSHCGLKGILDQALECFYQSLDQYTLGEVVQHGIVPSSAHSDISFLELLHKA